MPRTTDRRRFLASLGSTLALTGAGGLVSAHTNGLQNAPLDAQLAVARAQTRRYAHPNNGVERALDDGYQVLGPVVPGMGFHLVDFDAIDDHLDVRSPDALTVRPDGTLGSVEYLIPLDQSDHEHAGDGHHHHSPDLFNDEDVDVDPSEAHAWHAHHGAQHVFATPDGVSGDPSLDQLLTPSNWVELVDDPSEHAAPFPPAIEGLAAGDALEARWGGPQAEPTTRVVDAVYEHGAWNTLHAWVHAENPHGVFAPQNPAFVPVPDDGHSH